MSRITSLQLMHVAVPLKRRIRHASHQRTFSDNVIVRVELAGGVAGYGEGVPRSYVTGETIGTAFPMLSRLELLEQLGEPRSMGEAAERIARLELPETAADPRGMHGNAARCALEMALLDAYGKRYGTSISTLIREYEPIRPWLAEEARTVVYSGAVTASSPRKEVRSALLMRLNGMRQIKIKVGVAGQDDAARLRRLRRALGSRTDIRLDANEAWHLPELKDRVAPLLAFGPTALEQPVPHAEVAGLAAMRGTLGIPVMLDESLCGFPDLEEAIRLGTADLVNLRISKCGGIFPVLRLYARARAAGLGAQLGCHPGETGLLSAAGRHVAAQVAGWRYVEGSYDRHILACHIVRENLTFGFGGRAPAIPADRPGLGVTVDEAELARITVARRLIRIG
jgi:muconate cycloisomerase